MSEEQPKDSFNEVEIQIKTLFSKLTELIVSSCKTRKDVANMIVVVGNWVGVMFATLVVTAEGNDHQRSSLLIARIVNVMQMEIKKHTMMIRGMLSKSEEKRIITDEDIK